MVANRTSVSNQLELVSLLVLATLGIILEEFHKHLCFSFLTNAIQNEDNEYLHHKTAMKKDKLIHGKCSS